MPRVVRRSMLVLHICAGGAWLGLDVVMGVLVATSALTDDPQTKGVAYRALALVTVWPMTVTGLTCLFSGLVLTQGTKWGLFRYWWVVVKLAINLVLTTLILVLLRPNVADVAEQGRAVLAGAAPTGLGDLVYPPIVSTTLLLVAMVLSVFKPWGRIRSAGD